MNPRIYIAVFAAIAAIGLGRATTTPHAMKTVDITNTSGAKVRCRVGQEGKRLYVVAPTGIEVFDQNGAGAALDVSSQRGQFLRSGDVITVIHRGGVTTFTKEKVNQTPATTALRVTPAAAPEPRH